MNLQLHSLRTRLALLYLGVFGLIQVGLSITILISREVTIRRDFDSYLLARAELLADLVESAADAAHPLDELLPRITSGRPRSGHWELRLADGTLVQSSESLGDAELPWLAPEDGAGLRPTFWIVREGSAASYLGALRVLRTRQDHAGVVPYYIQLARETAPMERSIRELRRIIMITVPVGLLISAVAAGYAARRSLEPIGDVVREARMMTAANLSRRIQTSHTRDEMAELIEVINGMLARLQSAFEAQERFIADVSHELKTPLIALAAEAHTISRAEASDADRLAFLARARDSAERLARTVDAFLTLARAEAGFPLARPATVHMAEVVTAAIRVCAEAAAARRVRLRTTLPSPETAEVLVTGEEDLLRSTLENLLRNAVLHSPEGGVVDIEIRSAEGLALVEVADRGPGVPPANLERIFDRFVRFAGPKEPGHQGTGLGLAIVRAIGRLHGGDVHAEAREGGGLRFILHLPLASPD